MAEMGNRGGGTTNADDEGSLGPEADGDFDPMSLLMQPLDDSASQLMDQSASNFFDRSTASEVAFEGFATQPESSGSFPGQGQTTPSGTSSMSQDRITGVSFVAPQQLQQQQLKPQEQQTPIIGSPARQLPQDFRPIAMQNGLMADALKRQQSAPVNPTLMAEALKRQQSAPLHPAQRQMSQPDPYSSGIAPRSSSLPGSQQQQQQQVAPPLAGIHVNGLDINTSPSNVSIAGDIVNTSKFHDSGTIQSEIPMGQQQDCNMEFMPGGKSFNEAMEKLCESMKRSAMSRSLVKQLSGRSITKQNSLRALPTKQGSSRNLSRQSSGRLLTKQLSGRNTMRSNSGRNLLRSGSGRNLMDESAVPVPIRKSSVDLKFRIQREAMQGAVAPGRGLFRHKSAGNVMRTQTPPGNVVLQLNEQSLGLI